MWKRQFTLMYIGVGAEAGSISKNQVFAHETHLNMLSSLSRRELATKPNSPEASLRVIAW